MIKKLASFSQRRSLIHKGGGMERAITGRLRSFDQVPDPVHLDTPFVKGTVHYVARLPDGMSGRLSGLLASNELVTTDDGYHAAFLMNTGSAEQRVVHTAINLPALQLARRGADGQRHQNRILWTTDTIVFIWARARGDDRNAVWALSPYGAERIMYLDQLHMGLGHEGSNVFAGTCDELPGQMLLITKWGAWPVRIGSKVSSLSDGTLLILEQFGKYHYAYRVGGSLTPMDFCVAPCDVGEHPLRLLWWHNRYFLVVNTRMGQQQREFGKHRAVGIAESKVEGFLEMAWNGPGGRATAMLTRVITETGVIRKLYLNGRLVHEGSFMMDYRDRKVLYWSDNGLTFAAVINVGHMHKGGVQDLVVSSAKGEIDQTEVGSCCTVRDLLVTNDGVIDVIIQSGPDGLDQLVAGKREYAPVSRAWNLQRDPSGGFAYSLSSFPYLLRWTDRTDHTQSVG